MSSHRQRIISNVPVLKQGRAASDVHGPTNRAPEEKHEGSLVLGDSRHVDLPQAIKGVNDNIFFLIIILTSRSASGHQATQGISSRFSSARATSRSSHPQCSEQSFKDSVIFIFIFILIFT